MFAGPHNAPGDSLVNAGGLRQAVAQLLMFWNCFTIDAAFRCSDADPPAAGWRGSGDGASAQWSIAGRLGQSLHHADITGHRPADGRTDGHRREIEPRT